MSLRERLARGRRFVGIMPYPFVLAVWAVYRDVERQVWLPMVKNCDFLTAVRTHHAGRRKCRHRSVPLDTAALQMLIPWIRIVLSSSQQSA